MSDFAIHAYERLVAQRRHALLVEGVEGHQLNSGDRYQHKSGRVIRSEIGNSSPVSMQTMSPSANFDSDGYAKKKFLEARAFLAAGQQ